ATIPAPARPKPTEARPAPSAPRRPAQAAGESRSADAKNSEGRVAQHQQGDTGRLFADVELVMDAIAPDQEGSGLTHGVSTQEDLAAAGRVSEDRARSYMGQVRNVMLELKGGEARAEWLGAGGAVLRSLRRMAEPMEMSELCAALDGFQSTLAQVQKRCQGA